MAAKNPWKQKLKDIGFSEYMLSQFRKSQKEYVATYEETVKMNKKYIGNETATMAYSYQDLYEYISNTYEGATFSKSSFGGSIGRSVIEDIRTEQQVNVDALKNYGITQDIVATVSEAIRLIGIINNTEYNSEVIYKYFAESVEDYKEAVMKLEEAIQIIYHYIGEDVSYGYDASWAMQFDNFRGAVSTIETMLLP